MSGMKRPGMVAYNAVNRTIVETMHELAFALLPSKEIDAKNCKDPRAIMACKTLEITFMARRKYSYQKYSPTDTFNLIRNILEELEPDETTPKKDMCTVYYILETLYPVSEDFTKQQEKLKTELDKIQDLEIREELRNLNARTLSGDGVRESLGHLLEQKVFNIGEKCPIYLKQQICDLLIEIETTDYDQNDDEIETTVSDQNDVEIETTTELAKFKSIQNCLSD
ncbi:hypothetical protein MHBO_003966, partial [Bonamia ostreae]